MKLHTTVYTFGTFHYDVAYIKTFRQYLPESFANIKAALKLLDMHGDYTYGIEQVVLLREYWKKYPQDRVKLHQYASAGRLFCAPGMFTMPDSNIPSGENFIRNALIGRIWLKKHLGITPTCCWMADIFGHNPQSPQLAQTCGFTSYMFERGKSGSWKTTFNWKGIDGTTIAAHWQVDTYYGLSLGLAWIGSRPQNWIDRRIREQVLDPQCDGSPRRDVLMTPIGGDFLKPTTAQVGFVRGWNRRHRDTHLQFSNPQAYFDDLHRKNAVLPTEAVDLNPLFEGCYSTRIRLKQANRRLEELAASLEALEAMADSSHRVSEALWETLAFNAFHDIIGGSLVRKPVEQALAKYRKAETLANTKVASLLASLAGKHQATGAESGHLLFNSLPYGRREIVALPGRSARPIFRAVDLPPLGFVHVNVKSTKNPLRHRARIQAGGRVLENERLKIAFGPNGTIFSLYDKDACRELARTESGMNNPIRVPDIGDPWTINGMINSSLLRTAPFANPCPVSGSQPNRKGRINASGADADCYDWPAPEILFNDPFQATVQFTYPNLNVKTQITIRQGEKLVRIKTFFTPTGKRYRLLMAFPTSILSGRIRHSVPFGHLERSEGEYAVQGWIDYADRDQGLLLVNKGLPGNNVTNGVMMLSLFRAVSMEAHEKTPWFEEGIEQVFEYGLMPFCPGDGDYNPARVAALFNRELCVLSGIKASVPQWKESPLVTLQGEGAELSCLRREDDGLRLRLWESRGQNSFIRCIFARPITACFRTNAVDTQRTPVNFNGETVEVNLKPFEIVTLRVELNKESTMAR